MAPTRPSTVKLGAIDLNLLVVFDAVMQERNVTRAGERLALSQPAMSHALTRLRHMLKDDLFIRSPKGMLPTPRAEELAVPVRMALDGLQQSLEPTQFDPSKTTRKFRIAVDNYAAVVLVGLLAERVGKLAPHVVLEFLPSGTLKVLDLLDHGELDLAIGPNSASRERFSNHVLIQDEFVAVLRKNHPAAGLARLSIEELAALPHLEISSARHSTDFVDQALAESKLARRIALHAPFLSASRILVTSDMTTVLPKRIAEELSLHLPLILRRLPFAPPIIKATMTWPRWLDHQPAHLWLRGVIAEASKDLGPHRNARGKVGDRKKVTSAAN
jgi:DNA-binding transcriptional LysR family regulator